MYIQIQIVKFTNTNPDIVLLILVSKLENHLIKLKFAHQQICI